MRTGDLPHAVEQTANLHVGCEGNPALRWKWHGYHSITFTICSERDLERFLLEGAEAQLGKRIIMIKGSKGELKREITDQRVKVEIADARLRILSGRCGSTPSTNIIGQPFAKTFGDHLFDQFRYRSDRRCHQIGKAVYGAK